MPSKKPSEGIAFHTDPVKNSRIRQSSRNEKEKTLSSGASHNIKVSDELKTENPHTQSYADEGNDTIQSIGKGLSFPSKQDHCDQWVERNGTKDGELVKYMSNLPRYLRQKEQCENLQDKALNFGVLDWGLLEKWKHNQNQPPGDVMYSSFTTNTSPFSTLGSSTVSGKNDSGAPAYCQKQLAPLHPELMPSSKERRSHIAKTSRVNAAASQDFRSTSVNFSISQEKLPKTNHSFGTSHSGTGVYKGKEKCSNPDISLDIGTPRSNTKHEVSSFPKGKASAKECESSKRMEQYREVRLPDHLCAGREKTIVLLLPRDSFEKSNSQQFESKAQGEGRRNAASRKSFSKSFHIDKEVQFAELHSDIANSCPLPHRSENTNSMHAQDAKAQDHRSHPPHSAEIATAISRDKNVKENNFITKPSRQPSPISAETKPVKGKYQSPTRSVIGQISRSFSSREVSTLPQLSSDFVSAKSGPVGSDASYSDKSNKEKVNANGRSKSSPLRRLLNPLLKPKAVDRLQSVQGESTLMKACEASNIQLDSSIDNSVDTNLNVSDANQTGTGGLYENEKYEEMTVQALLKVTVNDGVPSFRFAVDNSSDILTAAMKKISTSEKYDCSWIYTFYSFHKSKKKSGGWMNQGNKGKNHDYVPKVVGEMKVSGSKCPEAAMHRAHGQYMVREFVLFGVKQKLASKAVDDFQPNNELAAIIVKVPKETTGKLSDDGLLSDDYEELSEAGLSECLRKERCSCSSAESLPCESKIGDQVLSSTTVILPRGIHGLPATGAPSPLIDRWRSGGSCDCGGWDMGCNLKILACQDRCSKNSSAPIGFLSPVQFELFVQGGVAQERPVFSLGIFKEGIYSVDYTASMSSLQAFSICTAVLHSWKLAELSEVSNLLEDKISQELTSTKSYRTKVTTGGLEYEGEAATCVPFPPLSPVGRV